MDKRKKRYNVLIGILSVILCVCMAAGIAFGMGGSETDPAEANAPGSAGVDAVGGEKESADASFPLIAPMAEELPPPVVLQSVSIREGSGDRAPVTGDTIDDPLDPDKGYQFELQFDVAVVSGDLASFKDLIVVWEQRAEEDVDVTGALILSGTGGYIRLSPALKAESTYALV
ncbi:MAG: hypothetical protein FWH28_03490, partial [Clostridiales bacterium]|nr:hypothetical protein [Clostridiales bacterium]